jgi:hypothetical protein
MILFLLDLSLDTITEIDNLVNKSVFTWLQPSLFFDKNPEKSLVFPV